MQQLDALESKHRELSANLQLAKQVLEEDIAKNGRANDSKNRAGHVARVHKLTTAVQEVTTERDTLRREMEWEEKDEAARRAKVAYALSILGACLGALGTLLGIVNFFR